MKKIAFLAAALFCLWQTPQAAANDQMDYLAIENRMQDEWVEYTYSYPQITRGESRVTEQRLNGFLREYSQSTALNARLQAKQELRHLQGRTTFEIKRNDIHFFSIVFSSYCDGKQLQKGFVFLPQNGVQLRLEDLFSSSVLRFYRNPKKYQCRLAGRAGNFRRFPNLAGLLPDAGRTGFAFPLARCATDTALLHPFGGSERHSVRIAAILCILTIKSSREAGCFLYIRYYDISSPRHRSFKAAVIRTRRICPRISS